MKIEKLVPKPEPVSYLVEFSKKELDMVVHFLSRGLDWAEHEACRQRYAYAPTETLSEAFALLSQLRKGS